MNTLQSSKRTSEEVAEQLEIAEQTEAKIDAAREVLCYKLTYSMVFTLSSFIGLTPPTPGLPAVCRASVYPLLCDERYGTH